MEQILGLCADRQAETAIEMADDRPDKKQNSSRITRIMLAVAGVVLGLGVGIADDGKIQLGSTARAGEETKAGDELLIIPGLPTLNLSAAQREGDEAQRRGDAAQKRADEQGEVLKLLRRLNGKKQ